MRFRDLRQLHKMAQDVVKEIPKECPPSLGYSPGIGYTLYQVESIRRGAVRALKRKAMADRNFWRRVRKDIWLLEISDHLMVVDLHAIPWVLICDLGGEVIDQRHCRECTQKDVGPTTVCADCGATIPIADSWRSTTREVVLCAGCFQKAEAAGRAREGA